MLLALAATTLVAIALLSDLIISRVEEGWARHRARRRRAPTTLFDPGRERRAEQRARELLRSCVNDEEWDMYRDLGFIRRKRTARIMSKRWSRSRTPGRLSASVAQTHDVDRARTTADLGQPVCDRGRGDLLRPPGRLERLIAPCEPRGQDR